MVVGGILGLLALAFCVSSFSDLRSLSERRTFVEGLPDVSTAAPGEAAILEGRIAASVPALHGEFVAYLRERHKRRGKALVDRKVQPLVVETASGAYTVGNSTYKFDRLIHRWTDSQRMDEAPTSMLGAVDIEGLVAKGPVMAIGRLAPAGSPRYFHAESVVGLPRAVYVERLAAAHAGQWKLLVASAGLGALGLFAGWRGWRRITR